MARPRSAPGYSLVEMLVVLVIIAVVSALVLPGMAQAMRERRVREAAVSVLDIARLVRSRALYRGRSQMLVVQTSGTALTFEAWEGNSNACRSASFGVGGVLDANQRVATLDLAGAPYAGDNINAVIASPSATSYLAICFTPTGRMFYRAASAGAWSDDTTVVGRNGGFIIQVFQTRAGVDYGVRRNIFIPIGGMPRFRT